MDRSFDSGLWCINTLAQLQGLTARVAPGSSHHAASQFDPHAFVQQACTVGLQCKVRTVSELQLHCVRLPAALMLRDGTYCLVVQVRTDGHRTDALIQKPQAPPQTLSTSDLMMQLGSHWIEVSCSVSAPSAPGVLPVGWWSAVLRPYRPVLTEVLALSALVQLLALMTPLLFQVLMDKVLVSRVQSTFHVIVAGLLLAAFFEVLMTAVRGFLLSHVGCRVDSQLILRLWSHVARLPLGYFQSRPVADVLARFRELEYVRQFMTGPGLTAALDFIFSVVFVALMFLYQPGLAGWVAGLLALQMVMAIGIGFPLRRRLEARNASALGVQGFLVEAVQSIATVKSLGIDAQFYSRLQHLDAQHARSSMQYAHCAVWAQSVVSVLSRLSSIGVMGFGASAVMTGQLTVGEMVAFNMLATQVTAPVLRLSQWWQDLEHVRLAHRHVSDVLSIPVERAVPSAGPLVLRGHIRFDQVTMRFGPGGREVLTGFDLDIRAGEMVALVGPSGCGKSTVTQILQRLCIPSQGRVMLDGCDVSLFPLDVLRTQIGVITQDIQLFAGSIAYNIAITDPLLSMAQIVQAAQWAGAHEFICNLPDGYETQLGAGGVGLSGGQRQRIGIARVLAARPRLLVFDEATSALDVDTEIRLCQRLRSLTAGRTTLVIAHRLSTVLMADRVVVMQAGRVRESGAPRQLLSDTRSEFYRMYRLQQLGPQIVLSQLQDNRAQQNPPNHAQCDQQSQQSPQQKPKGLRNPDDRGTP